MKKIYALIIMLLLSTSASAFECWTYPQGFILENAITKVTLDQPNEIVPYYSVKIYSQRGETTVRRTCEFTNQKEAVDFYTQEIALIKK